MSLNDNKLKLCNKYEDYLQLIYTIGNGLMFKKHVEEFAEKFLSAGRTSAQNILKELRDHDVIDFIQYQRAVVIKLKKIALQYLKRCEREDVSSLNVTPIKIKKSAYISALILSLYSKIDKSNLKDLISVITGRSTLLLKEREGYKLLNMFTDFYEDPIDVKMEADVVEKYSANSKLNINSKDVNLVKYVPTESGAIIQEDWEDIEYLQRNHGVSHKVFNEKSVIQQDYSSNSIIQGSTYMFYNPKNKLMMVYIFDLNDSVSVNILTRKIINFYNYMGKKLKKDIRLNFRICVSSPVRYKRFYEQADRFDKAFIKANRKDDINYAIKDLNISSLFLNRKIAMSDEGNKMPVPYTYQDNKKKTEIIIDVKPVTVIKETILEPKLQREIKEERQIEEIRKDDEFDYEF